jgi:hypothetical protein
VAPEDDSYQRHVSAKSKSTHQFNPYARCLQLVEVQQNDCATDTRAEIESTAGGNTSNSESKPAEARSNLNPYNTRKIQKASTHDGNLMSAEGTSLIHKGNSVNQSFVPTTDQRTRDQCATAESSSMVSDAVSVPSEYATTVPATATMETRGISVSQEKPVNSTSTLTSAINGSVSVTNDQFFLPPPCNSSSKSSGDEDDNDKRTESILALGTEEGGVAKAVPVVAQELREL